MSEWWTYRPSDFLLFSSRTYWRLFELHNLQCWPLHLVSVGLALVAVGWWWHRGSVRPLLVVCALAWGFAAWAFHLQRYADINWAAPWFAAAFAPQGLLLLALAVAPAQPRAAPCSLRTGLVLLFAALVLYPFVGIVYGRPMTQAEVFGVAPDPTALATMGSLLLAPPTPRLVWRLAWIVPALWGLCSGMTLWVMHVR